MRALESVLVAKGYVDPAAVDAIVETYEHEVGPHLGAAVVARAWVDPEFASRLLADATSAVAELGISGRQGRAPDRRREHRGRAQPRGLHAVLVLPVDRPGPAAGLVQERALSVEGGERSARRVGQLRRDVGRRRDGARARLHCGGSLPRGAFAACWVVQRGGARCDGHSRRDDRRGRAVNGAHDMGGAHGFGPVVAEVDELFHGDWERRVLGLVVALGAAGRWNVNIDKSLARETRDPAEYLSLSYYEIWLAGLERLLVENGLLMAEELERGESLAAPSPVRVLAPDEVRGMLARGGPADRPAPRPPRFGVGDHVRTLNDHPRGHTRLPRYARGHEGVIERIHGCHVFADRHALGDEDPQWLYSVVFDAVELWGADADPRSQVSFDAFEPYLEPL